MALTAFAATVLEQNDSKALVFTDSTGSGVGGWGYDGNISPANLDNTNYSLSMTLVYTDLTGSTTYDAIDLIDEFGPFATAEDMVYTITTDLLSISAVADPDIVDDIVRDGVWSVTLTIATVAATPVTQATYELELLTYNNVKTLVYDKLRNVPQTYTMLDYSKNKEISDALLCYTLLRSLEAGAYVALEDELLNTLDTLEKICVNGTNYNWQ